MLDKYEHFNTSSEITYLLEQSIFLFSNSFICFILKFFHTVPYKLLLVTQCKHMEVNEMQNLV